MEISRLKRSAPVLALLAVFAIVSHCVFAGAFEDAVAANPASSAGNMRPYTFEDIKDVPPPAGYRPFYISHYGRHGSRFQTEKKRCDAARVFARAAKDGLLTPKGEELAAALQFIAAAHEGRYGELSARGAREQKLLARRMHARFAQVFESEGRFVRCQSTPVPRCLASMANFAVELKGAAPSLAFDFETGERILDKLVNEPEERSAQEMPLREAARLLAADILKLEHFKHLVFKDEAAARAVITDPYRFAHDLFHLVAGCLPIDEELGGLQLFDWFEPEELASISRVVRAKWYMMMGGSVEFGYAVANSAHPAAMDIAVRADQAIATGEVAADLRFAHDLGLWALAAYIGLEGAGDKIPCAKLCDDAALANCMPMAANLQLVFYRNNAGDVLVKILFNERETRVRGLETVAGGFVRWDDLRARLVNGETASSPLAAKIAVKYRITGSDTWHGFRRTQFIFDGHRAWIAEPRGEPADGRPWTWTMQWADAFVERTGVLELLSNGWHHVTLDTFSNRMDEKGLDASRAFQRFLSSDLSFAERANLVGLSWGGFFSVRYACAHPDAVERMYLDAPLLNFDGFSGLKKFRDNPGKAIGPWKDSVPPDGIWSNDPRMPLNMAEKLAEAGIPVKLIYGGKDEVVPPQCNAEPFAQRFAAAGGKLYLTVHENRGHHPHGEDAAGVHRIADFFAARRRTAPSEKHHGIPPRKI